MASEAPIGASALALRDRIASGALSAEALVEAYLARIAEVEPAVRAWAFLDGEDAIRQARALDAHRKAGRPLGPLHGLPVGIKDVIDTARMPTGNGTPLDDGRVPMRDAALVARLRGAGAVILGKTVTTELAFLHPGPTGNPNAPGRTPGGSSSGSAAAVAAGMVPLAVGTQTGGSVIRPASFCGVVGFKPTFGAIPRTGVLPQSPSLDTVGVFARGVLDAALIAEALFGHDPGDPATAPAPAPRLVEIASKAPPVTPAIAFVRPPGWEDAAPEMRAAMEELAAALGDGCEAVDLPPAFAEAAAVRERINFAEMAKCYHSYRRRGAERLSPELREAMAKGEAVPARDYIAALDWPGVLNAALEEIFGRFDAILTPSAMGPAPEGLSGTGSPLFNGLWTLCGTPCISLPLMETEAGLPLGAQLVGRRGEDGRLLRTAGWLARTVAGAEGADA